MVILKTELASQLSVTKCTKLTVSADLYSPSNLSFFVPGVYCDELVTDTDRQLIRREMLHIQINDIAILFNAHLNRQYSC